MKKLIISSIILLLSLFSFSQNIFKNGYFITNTNDTVKCLINRKKWTNNPNNFVFKFQQNSKRQIKKIDDVKEFCVPNEFKYIRVTTKIDKSSNDPTHYSLNKEPEWIEKTMFLEVLVEGYASLYVFSSVNYIRYFYSVNNDTIKQFIHKKYFSDKTTSKDYSNWKVYTSTNNEYIYQLHNDLSCEELDYNIGYSGDAFIEYFKKYNLCKSKLAYLPFSPYIRGYHHIRFNIGWSSYFIEQRNFYEKNYKSKNYSFPISLEIEKMIFKNRFSIIFLPSTFHAENIIKLNGPIYANSQIIIKKIIFPIGIRKSFEIVKELNLFSSICYVPPYSIDILKKSRKEQIDSFYKIPNGGIIEIGLSYKRFYISETYLKLYFSDNTNLKYHSTTLKVGYNF